MAQPNISSVITIRLESAARLVLLLPILLALAGGWFALHWYVGDTLSEYSSNKDEANIEQARMAARWAPDDPYVHWRLGAMTEKEFSANNLTEAVREYQTAVSLSPNDYRYWGALGRALEAAGDPAGAEQAMRRAVELAPAYSQPHWYFGNVLLREGKLAEAFLELTRAANADNLLRSQVFNLAWQVFDGDVDAIAKVACPSPGVRVEFAAYLVNAKRFSDAMRIWSTLTPLDRKKLRAAGDLLKTSLITAKQFHDGFNVMRDIQPEGAETLVSEQFRNGGFENELALPSAKSFGWVIESGSLAQISLDSRAHSGRRSLRIVFQVPGKFDTVPVSQDVLVEPSTQYHFEVYARTEGLSSGSTPYVTIVDATDNTALANSGPLPTGTNDWQRIVLDFKTKPKGDGITLRIVRAPCTVGDVCPIFGTVWYDDFNLQSNGGRPATR